MELSQVVSRHAVTLVWQTGYVHRLWIRLPLLRMAYSVIVVAKRRRKPDRLVKMGFATGEIDELLTGSERITENFDFPL